MAAVENFLVKNLVTFEIATYNLVFFINGYYFEKMNNKTDLTL